MGRLKLNTLREMKDDDLVDKLSDLRVELGKLRVEGAKGTLRKEGGKVRYRRRDIARILTIIRERSTRKK